MKWRQVRWVVAGLLAMVACLVGWEATRPPPLRVEDAQKVFLDFNLAACERRLGESPTRREWYGQGEDGTVCLDLVPLDSQGNPTFTNIPDEMAEWASSRALIRVYFARGRVVGVTAEGRLSIWVRVSRSLGL